MVTSYEVISLDHLAEHMICLSTASSFWFSLNSSYDHEFHLSKRLGLTPQDYEFLLVAADLALFHKRFGFSIKPMKWKVFLEGHRFTTINCDRTFEVDDKKVDLNALMKGKPPKHRMKVNFIRIGVLYDNSPRKIEMQKDSDGLMIVTPPRLNGLRLKQQSFRQCVEQSKWNYLLEKEDEDDEDDKDDGEDDKDGIDVDKEDNATSSPTTSNKKRKHNAIDVSVMVTPGDDNMVNPDMDSCVAAALPPPPRRRQAAADVTISRCCHRRSHRAAANALPPSRCAPPPQRRRSLVGCCVAGRRHNRHRHHRGRTHRRTLAKKAR